MWCNVSLPATVATLHVYHLGRGLELLCGKTIHSDLAFHHCLGWGSFLTLKYQGLLVRLEDRMSISDWPDHGSCLWISPVDVLPQPLWELAREALKGS